MNRSSAFFILYIERSGILCATVTAHPMMIKVYRIDDGVWIQSGKMKTETEYSQ